MNNRDCGTFYRFPCLCLRSHCFPGLDFDLRKVQFLLLFVLTFF